MATSKDGKFGLPILRSTVSAGTPCMDPKESSRSFDTFVIGELTPLLHHFESGCKNGNLVKEMLFEDSRFKPIGQQTSLYEFQAENGVLQKFQRQES